MEQYSEEKALEEASKIRKLAEDEKARRIASGEEVGEPTHRDYQNAEESLEYTGPKLSELLQEPLQDYSKVIAEADVEFEDDSSDPGWKTVHSAMLDRLNPRNNWSKGNKNNPVKPEAFKLISNSISGNVLCDLGSARGWRMEDLAAALGASLYIEVDKFPGYQTDKTPIDPTVGRGEMKHFEGGDYVEERVLPELHVRADMLDFISRIKDSSVNIVINGIDTAIIEPDEYHELLAKEMIRVVKEGGIIFGNNTDSLWIFWRMIEKNPELKDRFEILLHDKTNIGVGGVVVIHKKAART